MDLAYWWLVGEAVTCAVLGHALSAEAHTETEVSVGINTLSAPLSHVYRGRNRHSGRRADHI
jgi:hypothetical protein